MSKQAESEEDKRKRVMHAYPKNSLIDALRIAKAIRDHSAGKPYDLLDLAKVVGYSPASSGFRLLITSSGRYGLTGGSYAAKEIALTELGKSIMYPSSPREEADGLKTALYNIAFFKAFFTDYDNSKLPDVKYLTNQLNRKYGIPIEDCEECYAMIVKNATELGILDDIQGSQWIHLSKLSRTEAPEAPTTPSVPSVSEGVTTAGIPQEPLVAIQAPREEKPVVFISHSKNMTIVDQIKTILDFGQFDFKIAEETETTAIPIPDKVFGLMKQCNCAIINVSADESEKKDDGTYGVNPNVLIEIGSAFLAYNQKVILLVDKRVKLPSNLQGLYRCDYEGDELTFTTALKLQKQLAEFRRPNR